MSKNLKNNLIICLSLLFFLLVDLSPFPQLVNEIKPSFLILSFIYWNLALPGKINLVFALAFGLISDFLQGTLLGVYPLIFILISYFCQRFFNQFRPLRFIQQGAIIFLLLLIVKFFLVIDFSNVESSTLTLADKNYVLFAFSFAVLSSFFWPPLFYLLRLYRRRWITLKK